MKRIGIILSLLLFSGCSTTLKQQWYDFTAYYNTFYNANRYFEAGLEADRRGQPVFLSNELIRIHPPPTGRGAGEFAVVIEKSADILRDHHQSRYVDSAVELIGKSYFYRGEFFAAQEKFRELYRTTDDPEKRETAIIWEGRIYLELGLYSEGVRFLEERLVGAGAELTFGAAPVLPAAAVWSSPPRVAETRAVLAQLYAFQGNHFMAGQQLLYVLEDLERTELVPRAYFHYGQLMEEMGNFDQALSAYGAIPGMRADHDLEYHARLREIAVLRTVGENGEALSLLRSMERDDKYSDRLAGILFEIARTERVSGRAGQAAGRLTGLMHSDRFRPDAILQARIYYELGEINRVEFGDYLTAAAYYDSAAAVRPDPSMLPADWDAEELAEAWGEYAQVRQELTRLDTLLELGRLPPSELEERLRRMEESRLAERRGHLEHEERHWEVDPEQPEEYRIAAEDADEEERHGFLNINYRERLEYSSFQFRTLWDDPPLADNWRRREAVTGMGLFAGRSASENGRHGEMAGEPGMRGEAAGLLPGFDPGEIPLDRPGQRAMELQIFELHYRLGNIYLLTLQMPEAAAEHFLHVWREGPPEAPKASALYALAEIAIDQGDEREAMRRTGLLMAHAPDSRQARLLSERMGLEPLAEEVTAEPQERPAGTPEAAEVSEAAGEVESEAAEIDTAGEVLSESADLAGEAAGEFVRQARLSGNPEESAQLLLEAASEWIRSARSDTLYTHRQQLWQQIEEAASEHEGLQALLQGEETEIDAGWLRNDLPGLPEELTGAEDGRVGREELALLYPYYGEKWDRARGLLREIEASYGPTPAARRAELLRIELERSPLFDAFSEPEER